MNNKITDLLEIWDPISNMNQKFHIHALHDDYEGFRILLQNDDSEILRITFKDKITYRNTDEMYYLKSWGNSGRKLDNTFYKVINSSFIHNFLKEMDGLTYMVYDIEHYFISTDCDCIDILSEKPPIVDWI